VQLVISIYSTTPVKCEGKHQPATANKLPHTTDGFPNRSAHTESFGPARCLSNAVQQLAMPKRLRTAQHAAHQITTRLPIDPITVGRRWGQRHPQGANSGSIGRPRLNSKPSLKHGSQTCTPTNLSSVQSVSPQHGLFPLTAPLVKLSRIIGRVQGSN
jgi:hypothetical protein